MNQTESLNSLNYDDGNIIVIDKAGSLEKNFSEKNFKLIQAFTFFFQHIFLEIALPLILFFVLKKPMGELYAVVISSIPNLLSTFWNIIIKRRFEPLSIILILSFCIGLGLSLGFKDAKLNLIQGPIVIGGIGMCCLVTLAFKKPIIYYFSRPWVTRNDPIKIKEFDLKWENPNYRRFMKIVSIVWGLGFILQAVVVLIIIFLTNLELAIILVIVLNITTIGLLIVWTYLFWYFRNRRDLKLVKQVEAYRI